MLYKTRGLIKRYGDVTALQGIDLEVEENETLGVIGRSGSGKTTLLRILAGLEPPTSGNLFFKNREWAENIGNIRQVVTMIFQTPVFLTGDVFTNVAYPLRLRKTKEIDIKEKVSEALDKVRLGGYEKRTARDLSGGEQQRIALARALVLNPEALLLDEPTSNLDPANISVINKVLEEESVDRTIIVSTHDYDQIRRLTHRTIHLENGRITEEGAPSDLVSIARVTENVFTGKIEKGGTPGMLDTGRINIMTTAVTDGSITIHVRPEDIVLSKDPVKTSMRNQFKGQIIAIEEKGNVVSLKVDAGEVFTVQVTKKSYEEMEFKLGTELYLSFKASSVYGI